LLSVKLLDKITPGIEEMRKIKGKPIPTALFAAGMFIFLSLIFIGSVVAPLPIGTTSGLGAAVSPLLVFSYRLVTLLAGFVIAIVFALIFYLVLAKLEPFGIDLEDVNKDAMATGIYVMSYEIFLGVILYMSLLILA